MPINVTNESFNNRFRQLFRESGETEKQFAERVGLNRNTVAKYKNPNNNTLPDAGVIRLICEQCRVSADWLVGLTDIRTQDISVRKISEYTGLTEKVIEELHSYGRDNRFGAMPPDPKIISAILLSREWKYIQEELTEFLFYLHERIELCQKVHDHKEDDITINGELEQNSNNTDVHMFKATREFTEMLDRMADTFLEIPEDELNGTDLETYKSYLATHYRLLYINARHNIDGWEVK